MSVSAGSKDTENQGKLYLPGCGFDSCRGRANLWAACLLDTARR